MRKQRILHLIASSHGGGATHVRDLAELLPSDQFAVTVGMPADGGNVTPAQIEAAGATFIPLAINQGLRLTELKTVRRLLQNGRFDLLHVHGARAGLYGRLAVLGLRQKPRVIFSIHGFATPYYPVPKRTAYLLLERLLQRVTDVTICVAQAEADLFLQHRLTRPEQIAVIHPGIPLERFLAVRPLVNPPPHLLTLCRLNIPRDFETLLAAFARLVTDMPAARLTIVGDGPLRPQVANLIRQHQLADQVALLGFRQDVPALLGETAVFVLTSDGWEGFPISTLEAQAAGVPVIVSDAGGAGEAVLHEQTGLLVPKRDVTALAAAMHRLLSDESLRQAYSQKGRLRAQTAFDRGTMVGQIRSVYGR